MREDVVVADLKPGVDGGSSGEGLPFALQRQVVFYRTTVVPGSIVVDRENRFLYLIDANNSARRYGIGIAQECLKGGSLSRVMNKLEWPDWRSSGANTKDADALLAAAGRPGSLLGARALLLMWLITLLYARVLEREGRVDADALDMLSGASIGETTAFARIWKGQTQLAWRSALLTLLVLSVLVGVCVSLSGAYHVLGTDRTGNLGKRERPPPLEEPGMLHARIPPRGRRPFCLAMNEAGA